MSKTHKCRRCGIVFTGAETRRQWLCSDCHVGMASRSRNSTTPCNCARIDHCTRCRNREYKYMYDRLNKEKNAEYHIDWRCKNADTYGRKKYFARVKREHGLVLTPTTYAHVSTAHPDATHDVMSQIRKSRSASKKTPPHALVWFYAASLDGGATRIRGGTIRTWRLSAPIGV